MRVERFIFDFDQAAKAKILAVLTLLKKLKILIKRERERDIKLYIIEECRRKMDDFDPLADVFGDDFDPTAGLLDDVEEKVEEKEEKVKEEEVVVVVSSSTDFSSSQEDDSKVREPEVVLRAVLCKVLEEESLEYAINIANDLLVSTKKKPKTDRVKLLLNLLGPLVENSTPKQTKRMCKRIVRRVAGKKDNDRRGSFQLLSLETLLPKLNKPVILSSLDIFKEDKAEMERLWGIDEARTKYNDDLHKLIAKIAPVSEKKLERRRMQMDAILSRVKNAAKARKAESSSSSNDASTEIIGAGSSESQVSVLDMLLGNSGSTQKDIIVPRFTMNFAGKDLLLDAQLKLAHGRRYGLVGLNGIGKTTLLRFIAAKAIKGIPADLKICHVAQETVADERMSFFFVSHISNLDSNIQTFTQAPVFKLYWMLILNELHC